MKQIIRLLALFVIIFLTTQISISQTPEIIKTKSGVEMVKIPAGSFMMGSESGDVDEKPHKVTLDAFYMDRYPVTQEEYEKVMKSNPSRWKGAKNPV